MSKHISFPYNNINLTLIIMLIVSKLDLTRSQDFQTLTPKFLVDQTSLMDVKDYDNLHLI